MRKPGAFINYQYRDCLFPQLSFRKAWDQLYAHHPASAPKKYLKILQLAAIGHENEVALALDCLFEQGLIPSVEEVKSLIDCLETPIPQVQVDPPELSSYDSLLDSPNQED